MRYYVLVIHGDVEPEFVGPFPTREHRDSEAKRQKKMEGDRSGIYQLDVEDDSAWVGAYSGGFFLEDPAARTPGNEPASTATLTSD